MDSPTSPALAKPPAKSSMDNLLGLLRIRVKRGVNLAVRDVRTSDTYAVVKMGKQVLPHPLPLFPGLRSQGLN